MPDRRLERIARPGRRHVTPAGSLDALVAAVDVRFARDAAALPRWPDPHRGEAPADDEYSRVTDARKWRVIGGRADAWIAALVDAGAADVDDDDDAAEWRPPLPVVVRSCIKITPRAPGALPLVVGRTRIADVDDAGVVLGAGDPATVVAWFPHCGCDACDRGSRAELDELDAHLRSIVAGQFRQLTSEDRSITVLTGDRWAASGLRGRDVRAVLAQPLGWDELSGAPWLPLR